jgi:hypothetical protein
MVKAKSVTKNKQGVIAIVAPSEVKPGLDGLLTVNGRKVLVVRGNDAMAVVGQVYTRFANERDETGAPFRFSRARGSLVEIDPVFGRVSRVTPSRMEHYLKSWFQFGELLQSTNGPVIILTSELPKMTAHLWGQPRFTAKVAQMFAFVD